MGTSASFLTTEALGTDEKAGRGFSGHTAWCRTDVQAGSAEGSTGFSLCPSTPVSPTRVSTCCLESPGELWELDVVVSKKGKSHGVGWYEKKLSRKKCVCWPRHWDVAGR